MIATLMGATSSRATRNPPLSLLCRRPYEEILQPCRPWAASQSYMACGIEHELRKVARLAILPKLLRHIAPEFDKSLRMSEHIGNSSCQMVLLEAIAKHLGDREL